MTRRRSVESETPTTGLPLISRKGPVYRSIRSKTITTSSAVTAIEPPTILQQQQQQSKDIGTWSGRPLNKKRGSLGNETFAPISNNMKTAANGKTNFQRNSDVRASYQYDQNGRRIKSTTTSPTKQSTSPLVGPTDLRSGRKC